VNNSLQQIAYTTTTKNPEKNQIAIKIFVKINPDEKSKSKIHITKLEKKRKREKN